MLSSVLFAKQNEIDRLKQSAWIPDFRTTQKKGEGEMGEPGLNQLPNRILEEKMELGKQRRGQRT